MKVIVTRDKEMRRDTVDVWEADAKLRKTGHGEWLGDGNTLEGFINGFDKTTFKVISGFTPRKGSKETIEITIKRNVK